MKFIKISALALCMNASFLQAQDNNNLQCARATALTATVAGLAFGVVLDTCLRYKRGEFKNNITLKRALTVTTTCTIAGTLSLLSATTMLCNE